jgi:hypothetical protein
MHYTRFRKHGDVATVKKPGRERATTCNAAGCDRGWPIKRGLCERHYAELMTSGTLVSIRHTREDIGYAAAHRRTKHLRGRATLHDCVDCGATAAHWSYDGGAPDERVSDAGQPFSIDASFYSPRCRRCHSVHDDVGRNFAVHKSTP